MNTYLSDDVMHRQAADLYEQQFDFEPESLVEAIRGLSEREVYEVLSEAFSDIPKPCGDLRLLLMGMADEFENYAEPSTGFNVRAGAIFWDALVRMKELLDG